MKIEVDYYPFGMEQPNRQYTNSEAYRYGFNGKENDREWGTAGLTQDYGFRLYNPAIAKFLSVDPLAPSYPWNSTYAFAEGRPIDGVDLDGLEWSESTSTEKLSDGRILHKTNFKVILRVANISAFITDKEVEKMLPQAKKGVEDFYTHSFETEEDGVTHIYEYSMEITFDLTELPKEVKESLKDRQSTPLNGEFILALGDGEYEQKGMTKVSKPGGTRRGPLSTQRNRVRVDLTTEDAMTSPSRIVKTSLEDFIFYIIHELGHTGGLPHPWDEAQTGVGNPPMQPETKKEIKKMGELIINSIKFNFMNSHENHIPSMRHVGGTLRTIEQFKYIHTKIKNDAIMYKKVLERDKNKKNDR